MGYRIVTWVHLSVLLATALSCHRKLDMEALLADNPRANIERREAPSPYYESGERHVINSRGEHVIYKQATTPKTVILIQPHPESPYPFGGRLPALLPNIPKHFSKSLRHAQRFIHHRTKKLHKLFRHFLGDDLHHKPHLEHGPHQYEHVPHLPPPTPYKIGVPAVKVEAYQEEPPKVVKVVHHHHPHGEVVKHVEPYGPKEVIKYSTPLPPREVVKIVKPHHHHVGPTPLPGPGPTKIVKYIEEHHHHEGPPPPPLPPPSPTPVVFHSSTPSKVVRYVETYETDGSKTVRVVGQNPFHHAPTPTPAPVVPPPPPPNFAGRTKTRITILQGDDEREPPIIYRDRVPVSPSPAPFYPPNGNGFVTPSGPPPTPIPPPILPPQHARPEPIIYSRGASGAASPGSATPPPPPPPPPQIAQPSPFAVTPQPFGVPPVQHPQVTPTPYPPVHPTPQPGGYPQQQPFFPTPTPPPVQYPAPASFSSFQRNPTQSFPLGPQQPPSHPQQPQPSIYGGHPPPPQSPFGQNQSPFGQPQAPFGQSPFGQSSGIFNNLPFPNSNIYR